MSPLSITWYGHASFLLTTPGGRRIVFDPWLTNPKAPAGARIDKADVICVSHGHSDHTTDVVSIARATGAPVVAIFELATYFEGKGLKDTIGMNVGGTVDVKGLKITMTPAVHSSGVMEDGQSIYLGEPAGYVVRLEDGRALYFAGDTALFGDMRLIGELYKPDMAFLPIGDHFTMGPAEAARAAEMLGVKQVVPMHFGTFPVLTGRPGDLRELVGAGVNVIETHPGDTV